MMKIKFCCTYWGSEMLPPLEFLERAFDEGYTGIEINLQPERLMPPEFFNRLEILRAEYDFAFIAQLVVDGHQSPEDFEADFAGRFEFLSGFRPDFINAHTGRDYYTFSDNCRLITTAENLSAKTGIPLFHETHRGRFSFHLAALLPYLDVFPDLKLTGDFSHFCTVSESLLEGQESSLQRLVPHIRHLHARVGSAQTPQVNDAFAPEWHAHLEKFTSWWKQVTDYRSAQSDTSFTITPEAGPFPYQPAQPFTGMPLCDPWKTNVRMMNHLNSELKR